MKKILIIFCLINLIVGLWSERNIDASISCNSLYITGADNYLEIELEVVSPDDEWITYLQFTFPAGITPNETQTEIENQFYLLQFNYTDDQNIVWGAGLGDTSMGFIPTSGNPYIFDINVDIDGTVAGPITVEYSGAGDEWGDVPHEFTGSFLIDPTLDNDLVAVSVSGNSTPTEGTETLYNVLVYNQGNLNQSGEDYTVYLYNAADEEIDSSEGVDLEPGEQAIIELSWIPEFSGVSHIYGFVDFSEDDNISNNTTEPFDVNIQSQGTILISIGEATSLSYQVPANFFYKSSLSECWYYPDEINYGGLMTQLAYYSNWQTDLQDMPLKIWVGESDQSHAAIGWVPADELTLVFDGDIDLPSGENIIFFPLDPFFPYSGIGNLVIMMERPLDTQYYSSSDMWHHTDDVHHPARTVYYYSDSTPADPFSPPEGVVIDSHPDIGLYFDDTPTGSLDGYIYGNDRIPLANAQVEIAGTSFTTQTDVNGYYNFPYVFIDSYDISASYFGYYDSSESVTIIQEELTSQDIYLDHLPTVNVSGNVITSDTGIDVTGAELSLEGYDNYYNFYTDDSGGFLIPEVFASHTYTLTINFPGYEIYTDSNIEVGDVDLDLGVIIVNEIAFPVYDVLAEEDHDGNALIIWQSPVEFPSVGSNGAADQINSRILESYNLYRLLETDMGSPDNWTDIAIELTETSFVDLTWPDVSPGVYVYAVTANYTNGVVSVPAFSPSLVFEAYIAVTLNISSDSGDDPVGAVAILTNHDGEPDHIYTLDAAQGGVTFFPEVYYGIYDLSITHEDHSDYALSDISIMDNITIPVILNELILPPTNLLVEDIDEGVLLNWSPPETGRHDLSRNGNRHLANYNIYVDDSFLGTTTELSYLVSGYPAGNYEFGVSAYYSSGNESEIITVEAFVGSGENEIPEITQLMGNYPNPFNPETMITYDLRENDTVELSIFGINGQKIKTLLKAKRTSGRHIIMWDGTDEVGMKVTSGIYLYRLSTGSGHSSTRKMILLK